MLQWIILFFKYGPALISLIREILGLIDDLTPEQRTDAKAELKSAATDYNLFKDRARLEKLRDELKRKCAANAKSC